MAFTIDSSYASSMSDDNVSLDSTFSSETEEDQSKPSPRLVSFTEPHLQHLNAQLEHMQPIEILRVCRILFPKLYQTSALGLTGLVILDMLSKLDSEMPASKPVDLIFFDTLHHFNETYDLLERVRARYHRVHFHIIKPDGADTVQQFEFMYGEKVHERASELYDWIAKVEPQQRAYATLGVAAVLTGRRRSQGGARGSLRVLEVDDQGIIKVNPMANWSFQQVQHYVREHDISYNELLDRGYRSVGDWHSTSPVGEGEDERAGRWKGQMKTECGIHNETSRYARFLKARKEQSLAGTEPACQYMAGATV